MVTLAQSQRSFYLQHQHQHRRESENGETVKRRDIREKEETHWVSLTPYYLSLTVKHIDFHVVSCCNTR